jgi:hypothetical protein
MRYQRLVLPVYPEFGNLNFDTQLRVILDAFQHAHADPTNKIRRFTHARCVFTVNQPANLVSIEHWKLLVADAYGVESQIEIANQWLHSANIREVLNKFLMVFGIASGSHGFLTVHFDPAKLSIDLLGRDNTPLFAEYLIDIEVEQRVQEQLALVMSKRTT